MKTNFLRNIILADALGKENTLAKELKDFFYSLPSNNLGNRIAEFFDSTEQGPKDSDKKEEQADYRMHNLLVRDFRILGSPSIHEGEEAWYGLTALDYHNGQEMPVRSLFLLGGNGSGKSTLFDAAERLFCDKIGEAAYRGFDDADEFQKHGDKKAKIRYQYSKGEFSFGIENNPDRPNADLQSFFISENSLQGLSKSIGKDDNWYGFFCECLNIRDLCEFSLGRGLYEEIVTELESKQDATVRSSYDILQVIDKAFSSLKMQANHSLKDTLINTIDQLNEIYNAWEASGFNPSNISTELGKVKIPTELKEMSFAKNWESAKVRIKKIPVTTQRTVQHPSGSALSSGVQVNKNKPKRVIEMLTALKNLIGEMETLANSTLMDEDILKLRDDLGSYLETKARELSDKKKDNEKAEELKAKLDIFKDKLSKLIKTEVKDLVDDVLKDIIKSILEKYFFKRDENLIIDTSNIDKATISIKVNDIHISKYFNTFRFRLFFIALQTAINLKKMKTGNFLFPIMIDDIFYANDYRNKHELNTFFDVIYKAADKMLGEGNLQMMFLTHDEQFMTALYSKMSGNRLKNAIFGRLLRPEQAKEFERCKMKTTDKADEFINLYLRMYENSY